MEYLEYPKIDTLFDRDQAGKVMRDKVRLQEFLLVERWLVTEKIDGENVRILLFYGGHERAVPVVEFGSRTAAAFAPGVEDLLKRTFTVEKMVAAFGEGTEAVVFAEAYGAGIRKGGHYRPDKAIRIFDVVVYGPNESAGVKDNIYPWWLNWENVVDVADKLGVPCVPIILYGAGLEGAVERVVDHSDVAWQESGRSGKDMMDKPDLVEGVVARTDPLLFTRRGQRLMWKLKRADFDEGTLQTFPKWRGLDR